MGLKKGVVVEMESTITRSSFRCASKRPLVGVQNTVRVEVAPTGTVPKATSEIRRFRVSVNRNCGVRESMPNPSEVSAVADADFVSVNTTIVALPPCTFLFREYHDTVCIPLLMSLTALGTETTMSSCTSTFFVVKTKGAPFNVARTRAEYSGYLVPSMGMASTYWIRSWAMACTALINRMTRGRTETR